MILSSDDLRWHRNDKTVLLDGAFDPLHAGHVRYFADAVKAFPGHLFICAVASDDDIRAKGREPLLDQQSRCEVIRALKAIDIVLLKREPVEHIIGKLKPKAYVKGADWLDKLPAEQLTACALHEVQIVYLNTVTDSSSDRLRAWALRDAEASLGQLEQWIDAHAETPVHEFNQEYFQGDWRAVPYTLEDRRKAEGDHPDRLAECFTGLEVLDVGCGPGYLVELLKERGMRVGGIDPSKDAINLSSEKCPVLHGDISELPDKMCDVAISREVLEHLPVEQVANMVSELFRVARKYVYVTTRFSQGALFGVTDERDVDPTHQTLLSQPFLRAMCVLCGGRRQREIEATLDHHGKGRVLVYAVH